MPHSFQFKTEVSYETASVRFDIALQQEPGDDTVAFRLTVDDLLTGERVPLNHEACPAVHDFTRGYTRWLGTKGVRASRGDDEITGAASGDLSSAQLLQVAHDAVDMIDQRFSNYNTSVIEANDYSDIIFEKRDGVAWLTLNRPETFNAKRGITMDEMADALLDASRDNSIRVVVIYHRRARLYGFFYTTNEFGTVLAPLVYGVIADLFSLNVTVLVMGAAALVILPVSLTLRRYLDPREPATQSP